MQNSSANSATTPTTAGKIQILPGEKVHHNGNHHPCRETGTVWYKHDRVMLDGKEIGRIQTKERVVRFGRLKRRQIETMTLIGNACVVGYNIDWLVRQAQAQAA